MWLPKPLYDALPIYYVAIGLVALVARLYVNYWYWPLICTVVGIGTPPDPRPRQSHHRLRPPRPQEPRGRGAQYRQLGCGAGWQPAADWQSA